MANSVAVKCEGCPYSCEPVPMPFDYLFNAINTEDATITKKALKILHGISFLFYCQVKNKVYEFEMSSVN